MEGVGSNGQGHDEILGSPIQYGKVMMRMSVFSVDRNKIRKHSIKTTLMPSLGQRGLVRCSKSCKCVCRETAIDIMTIVIIFPTELRTAKEDEILKDLEAIMATMEREHLKITLRVRNLVEPRCLGEKGM